MHFQVRVAHLSTSHSGGAGIAARRLNQGLLDSSFDSKFYAVARQGFVPAEAEIGMTRSPLDLGRSSLNARINAKVGLNESFFSLTSISLLNPKLKNEFKDTPIIHIHNWFNMLNYGDFEWFLSEGKKLVFTLHDTRLLTGGCHSTLQCSRYIEGCEECPYVQKMLTDFPANNVNRLREVFLQYKNQITFVSPSLYLKDAASKSSLLSDMNLIHIPNHLGDFGLEYSHHVRESGNFIIGVASADPSSRLKGGDVISRIENNEALISSGIRVLKLSDLERDPEKGKKGFWENIDVLLVPSRFDNSPNVIHEAKSLGIPIVATKVGGITELLEKNFDVGIDLKDLDTLCLEQVLTNISHSTTQGDRDPVIKKAQKDSQYSIQQHISLYRELLSNN